MIEILLGIAAIVLAVIAIAEVKSSTDELKEEIKALSEAESVDKKIVEVIRKALYNKTPEVKEVQDIYNRIKSDPRNLERIEQLTQRGASVLYKERDVDEYFKIIFGLAKDACEKKTPEAYESANRQIRDLLISLIYKRRGMGGISQGNRYVPRTGD
jgi:phosphoglycolate phosphatase-like HAD superfamily hydrolase